MKAPKIEYNNKTFSTFDSRRSQNNKTKNHINEKQKKARKTTNEKREKRKSEKNEKRNKTENEGMEKRKTISRRRLSCLWRD